MPNGTYGGVRGKGAQAKRSRSPTYSIMAIRDGWGRVNPLRVDVGSPDKTRNASLDGSRFSVVIRLGLEPRAHALKGRCSTC